MSVTINCPKCSAGLKLPDRSLLGRKGKCPSCKHRFILQEPDEVQLELAEPAAPAPPPPPAEPLVGTSAKWIPDESPAADPVFPLASDVAAQQTQPEPAANPFDFSTPASAAASAPSENSIDTIADGTTVPNAPAAPQESATSRIQRRRKKSRTGPIVIGVGTALFAFCVIGIWYQQQTEARLAEERAAAEKEPKKNEAWEEDKLELAESNEDAKNYSPTSGETVPVDYMPFTPHLLFHLRPSEVWGADRNRREFVATLGNLGIWLGDKIRTVTRFEPQEIEELTFAVNFGTRTSEPDVAAVVRLATEQSASDLQLKRFKGQVRPDLPVKIFESDDYSYMMIDAKTFAVAPVTMSDSLAEAKTFSRQPSVDLEVLLKESDRDRQMTLMFDVMNIDTHREYIFGPDTEAIADKLVLWFGEDIRTVSWSVHLTNETVHMETLLKNSNESSPLRVKRHIDGRFAKLPEQLYSAVRMMKPATSGYRDMIGRFPVMMKATILGTSAHVGTGYVRLVTLLPIKAAPNLAAASLFTWNQSLVTDFSGPAPTVAVAGSALPDKVLDRLKQVQVYVDFSGTPLQEALQLICDDLKVTLEINGDGLKQVALTQNMRQNHKLGEVPAIKALDTIINNPEYLNMMVMVVDEGAKKITVTSRPAAEAAGLPIFDLKQ